MPQSSETTLDPQNVAVPGLGVVAFPGAMNPDEMSNHIRMHLSKTQSPVPSQPGMQGLIPSDAGIRSQMWTDKIRDARDQIGKIIAPFMGIDWSQMADDETHGILRQMLPFAPVTHAPTQALIDKAGAKILDHVPPFSTPSRSLFIGPQGHLLDIGDQIHGAAAQKAGLWGWNVRPDLASLEDALREHQLARVHMYSDPTTGRELALHLMHEPTALQLDQIEALVNQMRPGEGIGYDIQLPNAEPANGYAQRPRDFWNAYFDAGK